MTLAPKTEVIEASYTNDDRDTAAIKYTGTWGKSNGEAWAAGNYKGTETFSSTTGDSVEYTFTGAGIRVIAAQSINHGYGDVYIDGVKVGQTNTYRGQNASFQYVAFQKEGLDPTVEHTIKIVVTGQRTPPAPAPTSPSTPLMLSPPRLRPPWSSSTTSTPPSRTPRSTVCPSGTMRRARTGPSTTTWAPKPPAPPPGHSTSTPSRLPKSA
ncbi:hypothetical protein NHF46_24995 [Arthrobacter alpinus]|nr:hypothetical protein [Arthrobacter alpinus]